MCWACVGYQSVYESPVLPAIEEGLMEATTGLPPSLQKSNKEVLKGTSPWLLLWGPSKDQSGTCWSDIVTEPDQPFCHPQGTSHISWDQIFRWYQDKFWELTFIRNRNKIPKFSLLFSFTSVTKQNPQCQACVYPVTYVYSKELLVLGLLYVHTHYVKDSRVSQVTPTIAMYTWNICLDILKLIWETVLNSVDYLVYLCSAINWNGGDAKCWCPICLLCPISAFGTDCLSFQVLLMTQLIVLYCNMELMQDGC